MPESSASHGTLVVAGRTLVAVVALAFSACGTQLRTPVASAVDVQAERQRQQELALQTYLSRSIRLNDISARLRLAGADLCAGDVAPITGAQLVGPESFSGEYYDVAAKVIDLTRPGVVVLSVVPGLPAAEAGLQQGDRILQVANQPTSSAESSQKSLLASSSSPVLLLVDRRGEEMAISVQPRPACRYGVGLANGDALNAFADGENVTIYSGMLRFSESDDEIAVIVGHELAHNALGHLSRKMTNTMTGTMAGLLVDLAAAAAGVNTQGVATRLGSQAGATVYSQDFEREADYMGLYFAAKGGYDIRVAPELWRRMAVEHPGSVQESYLASHPSTAERATYLTSVINEIETKQLAHLPLAPTGKDDTILVGAGTEIAATPLPAAADLTALRPEPPPAVPAVATALPPPEAPQPTPPESALPPQTDPAPPPAAERPARRPAEVAAAVPPVSAPPPQVAVPEPKPSDDELDGDEDAFADVRKRALAQAELALGALGSAQPLAVQYAAQGRALDEINRRGGTTADVSRVLAVPKRCDEPVPTRKIGVFIAADAPPVITRVVRGLAADQARVRAGEPILAVNGRAPANGRELAEWLTQSVRETGEVVLKTEDGEKRIVAQEIPLELCYWSQSPGGGKEFRSVCDTLRGEILSCTANWQW